jgi:hypothetical protein
MGIRKNLMGEKFDKWTVIAPAPSIQSKNSSKRACWVCRCECGNEKIIRSDTLLSQSRIIKDCGCARRKELDIINQEFGKLTVISFSHISKDRKHRFWNCRCECGTEKPFDEGSLKSGNSKSCGCWKHEWNKLPKMEASMHAVHRNYTYPAKYRGLVFDLTMEQFRTLTSSNCHYCGSKPAQKIHKNITFNGDYIYNGIDRVDNTLGYMTENCVPCCKICNIAKRNMPKRQFLEWVKKVYEHCHLSSYQGQNHSLNLVNNTSTA